MGYKINNTSAYSRFTYKIICFYRKLFFYPIWNVGIANCSIENFLTNKNIDIKWMDNPKYGTFIADQFVFEWPGGGKYMIYESFDYSNKIGKIAIAKLNDNLKLADEKIIFDDETHRSYPFTFKDQNKLFVVMEVIGLKYLELYELKSPYELVKIKTILKGVAVSDPTIVKYNDIWWLFFTDTEKGDQYLNIAYSDNLFGDWKLHPKNPVKKDITSSRSAGTPFISSNILYRPSQNGSIVYGGSIMISKIIKLTKDEFLEEFVREILPDKNSGYDEGLHNISTFENLTFVDGKKMQFFPFKFLISLKRSLRKYL